MSDFVGGGGLRLLPYFMCANSEGSARLRDKYLALLVWPGRTTPTTGFLVIWPFIV